MRVVIYFRRKTGYMSPYTIRGAIQSARRARHYRAGVNPTYVSIVRNGLYFTHPRHFIVKPIMIYPGKAKP